MAGGGEEIGKAYITIEARGGEAVAREVQKAQAAASGGGSSYTLPGWAHGGGTTLTGSSFAGAMGGGGGAAKVAEEIKQVEKSIESAAPKVSSFKENFKNLVAPLHDVRQGLGALVGSTYGLIGAVSAVVAPIGILVDYLYKKRVAALEAAKELSSLTEAWNQYVESAKSPDIDSVEGKLRGINDALAKQKEALDKSGNTQGWSSARIRQEQVLAESQAQEARSAVIAEYEERQRTKKASADTAAYESIAKRRKELEDQAILAGMEGAEKILEEGRIAVGKLMEERAKAVDDATRDEYDAAIEAQQKLTAARGAIQAQADQKAQEEKQRRDHEEIEREREKAEQLAQLYTTAANQSRTAIQAAFGGGTSGLLQEMISKLNVIATGIQRLN